VRLAFLLLLAANLGFFAWARFNPPDRPADPAPLQRQLQPEKLRIVSERELAREKPAPPAKAESRPQAGPDAKPPAAPSQAVAAQVPAALACLEWGGFSAAEAARAAQRLEPLALGTRLSQVRGEETASWWVHMPPQGSRASAQRKAAELKQLGVRDYFVVQEPGRWQWALSLGVFSTEAAARAHLNALQAKGVRTAVVDRRDSRVTKVWLRVRDVDAGLEEKLKAIAADFDGVTLQECAPRR
jgi:hypothetical protein